MIFWIFVLLMVAMIVLIPVTDGFSIIGAMIFGVLPIAAYQMHASDLGTIEAQSEVIAVYQERVESLGARLDEFEYPKGALLNADSPVAAIVASLTDAEADLARAKVERAHAIRSIERRRHGLMSGVIWLAGDYK